MLLNIADVGVRACVSAQDVRALATQTVRKAVKLRHPPPPRIIAINDLTPGPIPIHIVVIAPEEKPVDAPQPEPTHSRHPTIASIISAVCQKYGVTKLDLISERRQNTVVLARQVAMHLARSMTLRSFPAIGLQLGGRDHTTVMHGARRIKERREANPAFDAEVAEIEKSLQQLPGG